MNDFDKIKDVLKDKLIVRIDKTPNSEKKYWEFVIVFIQPERKQPGHCIMEISFDDELGMKKLKKILNYSLDNSIKSFKKWKRVIGSYRWKFF